MLRSRFAWLTAAAVLAVLPQGAALAYDTIPGDRSTAATLTLDREGQTYSYIDDASDRDWWRVSLASGKAYVLRGGSSSCGTTVSVYDRYGRRLKSTACYGYYQGALEFVAPYTGLFFVEFAANGRNSSYPYYYEADALNDCAGSAATTCTQPLDLDFSTRLQSKSDSDWRTMNLVAGRTYTAAATQGNSFFLSVRRPGGAILAYRSGYSPRIVFRAPSTGRYFVEVKSSQDTYYGSNLVYYIVANGELPAAANANAARPPAGVAADNAPRTPEAAKAAVGRETTD